MALSRNQLSGIFPAFPTPVDPEGRVNAGALNRLIEQHVERRLRTPEILDAL